MTGGRALKAFGALPEIPVANLAASRKMLHMSSRPENSQLGSQAVRCGDRLRFSGQTGR